MCHPAAPYVVMAIGAYVSAQSANQQAQDTNAMYVRNAQLRKQQYMNQIDRLREERMKVAKAGKVEAEKFSDAMLDQKKQLIEATGQAVVQTGEGTGERNAILNSINRQGLTNMNRIQSQYGSTQENLRGALTNINFQAIDAQQAAIMGIESQAKARGPSIASQLVGMAEGSAKAYQYNKDAGLKWGTGNESQAYISRQGGGDPLLYQTT